MSDTVPPSAKTILRYVREAGFEVLERDGGRALVAIGEDGTFEVYDDEPRAAAVLLARACGIGLK